MGHEKPSLLSNRNDPKNGRSGGNDGFFLGCSWVGHVLQHKYDFGEIISNFVMSHLHLAIFLTIKAFLSWANVFGLRKVR